MTMDDGLSALDNHFFLGGEENGGVEGRVDSFFLGGRGGYGEKGVRNKGEGGRDLERRGRRKLKGESEGREGMGRGWKGGCGKEKVKGGRVWGGGGRVGVGRRK